MQVVVAGAEDAPIVTALGDAGHDVTVAPVSNRPGLEEAGIHEADAYVLTDMSQATSIAVAKDLNEELKVVVYADGSLPDFASRQADIVVDPDLLEPATVADEL